MNLYQNHFLIIIQKINLRPNKKAFSTDMLNKNDITVLAPHLDNEEDIDNPQNIVAEFLNQYEQETTISLDSFKNG